MSQSWEFYQQRESGGGVAYPLWWICGLNVANSGAPNGFSTLPVGVNTIWALPWDQMRAVTVSKMMVFVNAAGQPGARCRLGIYQNFSNTNNVPGQLVVDAGELNLETVGLKTLTISQALGADTRYWAVLLSNNAGSQINGLRQGMQIFWGAYDLNPGMGIPTGLLLTNQTYGPLPAPAFPTVTASNLSLNPMLAIALAFSSVT